MKYKTCIGLLCRILYNTDEGINEEINRHTMFMDWKTQHKNKCQFSQIYI